MTSDIIRKTFLEFFRNKEHLIVKSAPMVVKDDPSLMFTNAGMNQFKDVFLGNNPPPSARVADSQKCLRVSGKHNDLEEVGHDTYHHTMFEMLGNWSFGDYFKKEAIEWAWELLTEVFKIEKERLYVTVFEGDNNDGLATDKQAFDLWKTLLPEERILFGNKKDNFWEMGESGPCGPCSEIHADLRNEDERQLIAGKDLVNKEHPQVIEIWNLVFIEFNRKADGKLEKLPAKHVDTGMGFERLCMVLQGKKSNYDTDVFQPLIQKISEIAAIDYRKDEECAIAMRVIADHIRAIAFAIADGQLPSNNKAGYVIRRILRRAVRYGFTFLKLKEPFMNLLVETLSKQMGEHFPELIKQKELIEKVVKEEEISFLKTLDTGINLLERIVENAKNEQIDVIHGKSVFELYDTYGFPLDLTELILREKGLKTDLKGFEEEMLRQKTRSRKAAQTETGDWIEIRKGEQTKFVGYDKVKADVMIQRYREVSVKDKKLFQLVFDQTPFYPESGGQVGDAGLLNFGEEIIKIIDTKRENNLHVHICEKLPADIDKTGKAKVDIEKRRATERNHSATHLMHHALREILGKHVEQKGSLVHHDYLRFDFSHFQKLSTDEIAAVESMVNSQILQNIALEEDRSVEPAEAEKQGALMLFGEKYGDKVRTIRFGDSLELCGGTHVKTTGSIGLFKIVSESAIAAGVRRIEAITAKTAIDFYEKHINTCEEIKMLTKNPVDPILGVKNLIAQNHKLTEEVEELRKAGIRAVVDDVSAGVKDVKGISFVSKRINADAQQAKNIVFALKQKYDRLIVVLGYVHNDKPGLTVGVSESLTKEGYDAAVIVRKLAAGIKGAGGGQAVFSTAGGKDSQGLDDAVNNAIELV